MSTLSPAHSATLTGASGAARFTASKAADADWRCTSCGKLLGVCRSGRMHLRFTRGHEYLVGFPVQATCRGCGTLNQATAPTR